MEIYVCKFHFKIVDVVHGAEWQRRPQHVQCVFVFRAPCGFRNSHTQSQIQIIILFFSLDTLNRIQDDNSSSIQTQDRQETNEEIYSSSIGPICQTFGECNLQIHVSTVHRTDTVVGPAQPGAICTWHGLRTVDVLSNRI